MPAALSGAAAARAREIADLQRFSPLRVYSFYGLAAGLSSCWLRRTSRNLFGVGGSLADIGNVMFLGTALFTLVASSPGAAAAVPLAGS